MASIHEHHCEVSRGGTRDHVARVLLMAWGVSDDELAALSAEVAIGDVDRDALLALCGQAVDQEREVQRVALRALLDRVGSECGELVLEDRFGLIEESPDEGALAIIDAATGDEAQHRLVLVGVEV